MENLTRLAELLKARNAIDKEIAALVGRPGHSGHLGEYIAAAVFDIQLHESAAHKGSDGYFVSGPLAGRTVNIKMKGKHDRQLNLNPLVIPDEYLVLVRSKSGAMSSRGTASPLVIEHAFLFDARYLLDNLQTRGVNVKKDGTSVANQFWHNAEIYPMQRNERLKLSDEQRTLLRLFQQELEASAALSS